MVDFFLFFVVSLALLLVFTALYVKLTPYREFELIAQGNVAAALSLSGAIVGVSLVLASAVYFTHSLVEMLLWGSLTMVVQGLLFMIARKCFAKNIENGNVAEGLLLAAVSIAVGVLNAMSISY